MKKLVLAAAVFVMTPFAASAYQTDDNGFLVNSSRNARSAYAGYDYISRQMIGGRATIASRASAVRATPVRTTQVIRTAPVAAFTQTTRAVTTAPVRRPAAVSLSGLRLFR